jgi:hypothetical protein
MELNKNNETHISKDSEAEILTTVKESSSSLKRSTTNIK